MGGGMRKFPLISSLVRTLLFGFNPLIHVSNQKRVMMSEVTN
jgi:hypothetical protein